MHETRMRNERTEETHMRGMPKRNSTMRLDEPVKEAAAAVFERHGMTMTEAVEGFLAESVYRGEPAVRESVEAHLACERIRYEALLEKPGKGQDIGQEGSKDEG